MRFTFDQLESFIAVADEEHFSRAAERLHVSQPQLSRQIQTLERHLGARLFDRRGRRTRLTPAGSMFLTEARRIVRLASDAGELVRRSAAGVTGTVHLGYTSVVGNATLPGFLAEAAEKLPDVRVMLHEIRTPEQGAALRSGRIDIALGRAFDLHDDIETIPLPPDDLVLASPVTSERIESLSDLTGRPFIMYSDDDPHYVHDIVTSALTVAGARPAYVQRAMEVYTILSLVDAEVGSAIVPASTHNWAGAKTTFTRLPDLDGVSTRSIAAWRPATNNPSVALLMSLFDARRPL